MDRNHHTSLPASTGRSDNVATSSQPHGTASSVPRSRFDESWVEVSSRPSSSSLSSAADEIITDGLRVQHDSNLLRRRRLRRGAGSAPVIEGRRTNTGGSSQEEYEESESESDRVMTSSNEAVAPSPLQHEWRPAGAQFTLSSASSDNAYGSEDADDDENATAIGVRRGEHCFTPQPNAFTHPPSSHRSSVPQQPATSYFAQRPTRAPQRHSYPAREQHSPYNVISPSHHADHDAALRASLSTLLSCAAAARGLPKSNRPAPDTRTQPVSSNRVDPMSIGLIPESEIYGTTSPKPTTQTTSFRAPEPATSSADKARRRPSAPTAQRSSSKDRRNTKKAKRTTSNWTPATMEEVNPTLLTWFVGAGVVVLFTAISFSAGYITGREAGRAEMLELGMGAGETGRCGKEVMLTGAGRGLKRQWLADAASSIRV